FNDHSISGNVTDPINSWYWNFGDGSFSTQQNPSHSYIAPGTYSVTLSVATGGGCKNNNSSGPMIIHGYPFPVAAFSVNSTSLNIPYDVLICNNQSTGANTYNWNFGDGNTSTAINPHYLYNSVGIFHIQLISTSVHGCQDTAFSEVTTNADVIFPNAFTPNTSGPSGGSYTINNLDNDVFFPYTSGVTDFKLQIFDRWGELIFESRDVKQGWDGYYRERLCQQDVYVWKAYIKLNNGKIFNKSGDVTLLR
ncbi:MAG TPA: PKD domain-containing protein, partial [Nitrosopumilaceae archaeon]|nr:PKD domain-containing protein [Nitrosopumilaceae archaeon]